MAVGRRRGRGTPRGTAGTSSERAVEAGTFTGVAGASTFLFDLEQQRIGITVVVGLADELAVAARVALAPQLLATPRPVDHATLFEGHLE